MFKVNGYPSVDRRLHLSDAPVGLCRMAHKHSGFKQSHHLWALLQRIDLMPDKPDLAALVGSRICHDLISPIGAIGNGVELMLIESAQAGGPELALISESVGHANARIRFFRVAFGTTSADQRIARSEVSAILADMSRGGRTAIEWRSPADLPRRDVKLVFLLLLCAESAMPYGGRITVERGDSRWAIHATSPKLKIDTGLWECLADPAATAEIGPAQVQFLLVPDEINRQHRRLSAELSATEIRLSF